jgi:hypothetical protein
MVQALFLSRFRFHILRKRIFLKWLTITSRWSKPVVGAAPVALAPKKIPRTIWIYWAQGLDAAPEIVKACVASWRQQNPSWEIRVLDRDTVGEVVDVAGIPAGISLSHFSDVVRVRLLLAHGGVWADATTYCQRPLDHWLAPLMQSGFFAFSAPHRDRMIASWFLASEPDGLVVRRWSNQISAYWARASKADHYLWLHYLFEWMVRVDPTFARAWNSTPKVSADGPHLLRRSIEAGLGPGDQARTDSTAVPLYKLTWKVPLSPSQLEPWGVKL